MTGGPIPAELIWSYVMEFNKKAAKARRALTLAALAGGVMVGSLGILVATATAGNAPADIIAKPPCVMQPACRAATLVPDEQASVPPMPTLDALALHAALQNSSVFGLLRALHEPDPASEPRQKWCKN
jgi:hypothetical protein